MKIQEMESVDLTTLDENGVARLAYDARKTKRLLQDALDRVKTVEKRIESHVNQTFLAGLEKAETTFGSFKRTKSEFMKLPEEGWQPVYEYVVDKVKKGEDVMEAFAMLSYIRLNTKYFEKTNDDDLPIGISRTVKEGVTFTPKRNINL